MRMYLDGLLLSLGWVLSLSSCQTVGHQSKSAPRWSLVQANPEPLPLAHSVCAAIDGQLLVFGGISSAHDSPLNSDLHIFHGDRESWQLAVDQGGPSPRNYAAFTRFEKRLVIFGGETAGQSGNRDAFAFDLSQGHWSRLPEDPRISPRRQASLTRVGDSLIVFGGKAANPPENWARFDWHQQRWTVYPHSPRLPSRVGHVALSIGPTRLWIWGGFQGQQRRADGFILDVATGESMELAESPLLTARANARALLINASIYVWGGASADENANSGAVFELASQTWRALPAIPDPVFTGLKGPEIAAWRQGFLLVGGRFADGSFNDQLWYFDALRHQWSRLPLPYRAPGGRLAHCFVPLSADRFALFGGLSAEPRGAGIALQEGIWLLDLEGVEPPERVQIEASLP